MEAAADKSVRAGYAFAVVSSFGAGLATVVGKWNLEAISALVMSCMIFTTATIALTIGWLPFRGWRKTFILTRQGWFWLALFTITSWLAIWFFWAGVRRMDPTLAAFVNRLEVPIVIFLGVLFLKERFTRTETIGAVLSLIGIVLMKLTLRFEYSAGFWLVLLGALLFGITEFVSKIAMRHVEPITLAYLRNMFMAAGYWVVFAGGGYTLDGLDRVWPGVLALGLIGPILSRMMYMLALKRMELSKVAVISQIQPIFVVLIALIALGQLPTPREVAGGVFLIVGCVVMVVGRNWRHPLHGRP
ncbi:MAG: DMT family transporter [bacterium]